MISVHNDCRQGLETYNEERLENAKRLVNTTDRFFGFAAGTDWLMNFLRLHVLPPIAKYIFSLDVVRRFAFPAVSQIGINYRHSSLSNHVGDEDFEVKAGDRMPYFLVDGQNIFDWLQQPKFHVLVFASEPNKFQILKDELEKRFAQADFHAISHSHEVAEVFGTNKDFMVLLRPDNHIALMSSNISSSAIREYFDEVIGTL